MRKFQIVLILGAIIAIASCSKIEKQPLKVAQIFTDHMVLQANKPVNIWGTTTPKSEVKVQFRNQSKVVKANEQGKWSLTLDTETYGGPDSLIITSDKQKISLYDVLVGEVWLCSGQSNMEMPVKGNWGIIENAQQEVKNANYPNIRLFTVSKNLSFTPIDTIITQGWLPCDTNSIKEFSSTAYFFGRKLFKELNVPIGLIHSSWGGTVAEAWTSNISLAGMPDFETLAARINSLNVSPDSLKNLYETETKQMFDQIALQDAGIQGEDTIFDNLEIDDSDWMPIDLPAMWEGTALGTFDGSVWFRKTLELSSKQAEQLYTLTYGAPDDWDEAWVNGIKVGTNKAWDVLREYKVPAGAFKPGKNVITIRIYDNTGNGGFMGKAENFYLLADNGSKLPIDKGWVAKKGFDFKDISVHPISVTDPNQPTVLYNAMIYPLIPFTFQGVIWYQGESNSGRAYQYRELFKTMITDWRSRFVQGDFPFLFVQLANYLPRNTEPVEDAWAELREAQAMALDLSNTGMAVTIDIGDALDIHPHNKQEVGLRLALNALAKVYNQDIPYASPMFNEVTFEENQAIITLKNTYGGLKLSEGTQVVGFTIAGDDKKFYWADAVILSENSIEVSCKEVDKPVAVRYGWSSNPEVNVVNSAGLPLSPFRTDNWKGVTQPDAE